MESRQKKEPLADETLVGIFRQEAFEALGYSKIRL